jgi:hypothetical protein
MHPPIVSLLSLVAILLPQPAISQTLEDLPSRKPGQWEIRMVTEKPGGVPEVSTQVCIDASTDREIMEFGLRMSKKTCAKYAMKRESKGFVIDAECAFGPVKSVTRTTISGDFQSSYAMRIEGTTEGGFKGSDGKKGPQPTLMVHTARWAGAACTGGMKPGDMTMPGGVKLNVKQLRKLQDILPKLKVQ